MEASRGPTIFKFDLSKDERRSGLLVGLWRVLVYVTGFAKAGPLISISSLLMVGD